MKLKAGLVLLLLLGALDARAQQGQFRFLDDPLLTTGSDTDRVMIAASSVSTSQQSVSFTANGAEAGVFTLVVTLCTACNLTFKLEVQDPDGTWYTWQQPSAPVSATGTSRYCLGGLTAVGGGTDCALMHLTRLPPKFRAEVVMTGTLASYTVGGMVW